MDMETGPLMDDERFFGQELNYTLPGTEAIKEANHRRDYPLARKEFAAFIRNSLDPDLFFTIPYEEAENLYTLPGESEEDAADRICRNEMVSCGEPFAFGEKVDWFHNPTYNAYPEWTWQLNRHNEWKLLAHTYRCTKKDAIPRCVAEQFKSWVGQAVAPGDISGGETLCWRTIECGIRMGANWPYVLHAFGRTEHFTDDILVDWYKSVCEHGYRLREWHRKGNWLIMEMNGLAHIGILCPVLKKAGEWLYYALEKLDQELDIQIYPDGFQSELATGYHDVVIRNYQRLIRTATAYGVSLPESFLPRLEKMTDIFLELMKPNGRLPDINDGTDRMAAVVLEPKLELFPAREDFRWAVSEKKEGHPPTYTSVALPYSGIMVMREGWEDNSSWALFDAAPFGTGHQHEDKLSLLLFACGRDLLVEGGNYAYDSSEMRRYVLSTRAHNTVQVDGMGQNRRKYYLWHDEDIQKESGMSYHIGENFDFAEGTYDEGYGPDAERIAVHSRSVYFLKKPPAALRPFFLVADRLSSELPRYYELLWHLGEDEAAVSGAGVSAPNLTILHSGEESGFQLVRGLTCPEYQGWASSSTGKQGDYYPVYALKQWLEAASCRNITLLYPGESCPVSAVRASTSISDTAISLLLRDGTTVEVDEADMAQPDRQY
ncbi:MAG: alginate lyase family protein [Oscillospiraceae bacterium]